jgi:cytochrome c oxidase subunit 2
VPEGTPRHRTRGGVCLIAAAVLLVAGCGGPQSTLDPAGQAAERIADLFWWMAAGAVVVWIGVIGLAVYAVHVRPEAHNERKAKLFIIGGGAALPTVVLAAYLIYGLGMMPALLAPVPEGGLRIGVAGEQWWWRVRYPGSSGAVELANEVRLPLGERVEFILESPDVIHAFWVPSLGGKIDMIPGRVNRLVLEPTETGVFRGACAEYCGTAHALMNFYVVVMEQDDFAGWLAHQAGPAQAPAGPLAARGQELFLANGCGACHAVRGTSADGVVGPDLTHVGSRLSLGAGVLPNEPDDFLRWIARTEDVKPGVHMPAFGMLPAEDLRALAVYLDGLE